MKDEKALVIFSGGQDSTTCLGYALENFKEVACVTFDYGQRHVIEIESAKEVVAFFEARTSRNIAHEIVKVPDGCLTGTSFLTDKSRDVETFDDFSDMSRKNAAKSDKLDKSFVPMRNPLFLTIAANRAACMGAKVLITGVTAADFAEYGEFSWPWLAGFVDAEGCFTVVNGDKPRLSISQKDPELLYRIGRWVVEQIPEALFSVYAKPDGDSELYFGSRSLQQILEKMSPHMQSDRRREQAERCGCSLLRKEAMSDAYVAAFWEGDGSVISKITQTRVARSGEWRGGGKGVTATFAFLIHQKDEQVLENIQDYLGHGYLRQRKTQNKIWDLVLHDGPVSAKLLKRFRPHINVLGSFKKITKWRHNIGLDAGFFNPPYPDCTPDFIRGMQKTIQSSLANEELSIVTPVMFKTKAQAIRMAGALPHTMEALAYSHTAYDGKYPPTGKDHASVLRAQGFFEAGVADPLVLRAYHEGLMTLPRTANYDAYREGELV